MTEKEKMMRGMPYNAMDRELTELQRKAKMLTYEYNMTRPDEGERRGAILKELLGKCSSFTFIEPHFRCDFGFNIHTKGLSVINYNCVMLDTAPIHIGANAFIGPGTVLACAGHPMYPEERAMGIAVSKPITLEDDVWLGANCTVIGGVTIGKGSVIGAGSVVTKDIPSGVVAAGNPCRIIREITENDRMF